MPVYTKMGGYTIAARKTQDFTFWWGITITRPHILTCR